MYKNKRLIGKEQKDKQRQSTLWATCGLVEGDTYPVPMVCSKGNELYMFCCMTIRSFVR